MIETNHTSEFSNSVKYDDGTVLQRSCLSDNQKRLWLLQEKDENIPQYCVPISINLEGEINLTKISESCNQLFKEYGILRTRIIKEDGLPYLQITDQIDLRIIQQNNEEEVVREIQNQIIAGFKFEEGPLSKILIFDVSASKCILSILIHHIVTDGWSNQILIKRFFEIYNSDEVIEKNEILGLDDNYFYAKKEEEYLNSELAQLDKSYWATQLVGLEKCSVIPYNNHITNAKMFEGEEISFSLPKYYTPHLRKICKNTGTTPYMVFLSALMILHNRYSGNKDVAVGSPVANRMDEYFNHSVGYYTNTLILRKIINNNDNFQDHLIEIRSIVFNALQYQQLPFGIVMDNLSLKRDLSNSNVLQTMLVWGMHDRERIKLNDCEVTPFKVKSQTAKFDFTISAELINNTITGAIEYRTSKYTQMFAKQLINHFTNILKEVLINPNVLIKNIQMTSTKEKKKVLQKSPIAISNIDNFISKYQNCVEKYPTTFAIVDKNKKITYRELDTFSSILARNLLDNGVKKNNPIGIYVTRSLEYIIALWAIIKTGGSFVPLDPEYPIDRLEYIVNDCKLNYVITNDEKLRPFKTINNYFSVNTACSDQTCIESTIGFEYNPELISYIMYTSGSTGNAKGVMIKQKSLNNLILSAQKAFKIKPNMRVSQFVSINFDVSIMEILTTICSGATLYLINRENGSDPRSIHLFLNENKIEVTNLPMSILDQMKGYELPFTKVICTGGEKCITEIAEYWSKKKVFFNIYGPTETTIAATWFQTTNWKNNRKDVPIGKSIDNVYVYILDENLNICPPFVTGEIYIGGIGISDSYINITENRRIRNPFNYFNDCEELYQSGDFAEYDENWNIVYKWRKDEQHKINGYRVDLLEIEQISRGNKYIHNCAISLHKKVIKGVPPHQIVAHIVLEHNCTASNGILNEIKQYFQTKLPQHSLPTHINILASLPLTPNDKLDRLALNNQSVTTLINYAKQPTTEIEVKVLELWKDFFDSDNDFGIEADFFELGGHSLLVPLLINEIYNVFNIDISLKTFFENSSVASLSKYISEARGG